MLTCLPKTLHGMSSADYSYILTVPYISLLSRLGKLQERILHSAIMNFLSVNNAISPSQFGFRPDGSMQEALISMSQLWHQAMEAGGSTFLDITKAFDSVPYSMIIDALSKLELLAPC